MENEKESERMKERWLESVGDKEKG